MGEEEEPFWGEMARLLAQDDEEDALPSGPWRNGSPYNVGVLLLLLSTTKWVRLALLGAVLNFG